MKFGRFTANSGEIFHGDKPQMIGPTVDIDKVLDIMIGQLQVLKTLSCPAIYIPREGTQDIVEGEKK